MCSMPLFVATPDRRIICRINVAAKMSSPIDCILLNDPVLWKGNYCTIFTCFRGLRQHCWLVNNSSFSINLYQRTLTRNSIFEKLYLSKLDEALLSEGKFLSNGRAYCLLVW